MVRKKTNAATTIASYTGPIWDRIKVFDELKARRLDLNPDNEPAGLLPVVERRDGSAQVFDPDPRTTLGNDTLTDSSEASLFDEAYFDRVLKDLAYEENTYTLTGPWITIKDFEAPVAAPSTTEDGNWTATRGNNAFNDAMTYFHIDQSQRYIQSLGFNGNRGIQNTSIEVDTNGVNGDDNSYFIPSLNRLSFGHGCVDDNEDADVILHEYGHAIHFWINKQWGGGDSGAIGEGFGDYWAGTYSITTQGGRDFQPFRVYTWDGGDACWGGRRLDKVTSRYNHDKIYDAHQRIDGGHQSDELWATPIFQARVELLDLGIPREEVDTVLLEAQFGLGSGIKMRDMPCRLSKPPDGSIQMDHINASSKSDSGTIRSSPPPRLCLRSAVRHGSTKGAMASSTRENPQRSR